MKRWIVGALVLASCVKPEPASPPIDAAAPAVLEQGWTPADRAAFYTGPQGSRMIPAAWFAALQRPDDTGTAAGSFAADRLARYGYLPNNDAALPIGFVVDRASNELGMTCAACHTGAIRYKGRTWRIDGGRANADFQRFLTDLVQAMRATLQPGRFAAFAQAVNGPAATPAANARLEADFRARTAAFGGFMDKSLPPQPWGAGRLDAFGMIFNRVTALDLGLDANFSAANAPVRYPFLWNAPFQDATQWDGAAPNGTFVKGLARNTGEVFGVFGRFEPKRVGLLVDYRNSVDFRSLHALERKVVALKPPPWPKPVFGLDPALAAQGAVLFDRTCAACHGKQASKSARASWATPVCRVGTDPAMVRNALAMADTGLLAGTPQLSRGDLLTGRELKLEILANAVVGSLVRDVGFDTGLARAVNADIVERLNPNRPGLVIGGPTWPLPAECSKAPPRADTPVAAAAATTSGAKSVLARETAGLYQLPAANAQSNSLAPAPDAAYEARVLEGIWAAGPYLHNGSVPTLWELLTPAARRARFPTGLREFDPVDVGVAASPAAPGDFDIQAPGNSNAGHEYGATLSDNERRALLEYLKTL